MEEHGNTTLALVACHAGDLAAGEAALAPLVEMGEPMFSVVAPMPYATLQSSFDAGAPDGGRYFWKAAHLDDLSDGLIATLAERLHPLPGRYSNVFVEPMGGAISRVGPDATAFPHRSARFGFGISSGWEDPADDEKAVAWTRGLHEALTPHASKRVYTNYVDRDEGDRLDEAWGENRSRLARVKAKYDPDGVFEGNVPITV